MTLLAAEILLIILLILVNGILALSEMAIVSARKTRLQQRAEEGDPGAQAALELANAPSRFLSTVQVGITLVGILAGALGGATIAEVIAGWLRSFPAAAPYSEAIGVLIVVLVITFLTLIIGELVPKRLALSNPERLAAAIAPTMRRLSKAFSPAVNLLSRTTEAVMSLLNVRPSIEMDVTEEEIKLMIEQGTLTGVFNRSEQDLVRRAFRLDDLNANALMTPRPEVVWLDLSDPVAANQQKILASGHSRFPVARDNLDDFTGIVHTADLLAQSMSGEEIDIAAAVRETPVVPEGMAAFDVLERIRETRSHMAVVIDEYGGFQGLLTATDILEALVGDIPTPGEVFEPMVAIRDDGSLLADGMLLAEDLKERLRIEKLAEEDESDFQTLGGFVMTHLGQVPEAGDRFEWAGWRFEVVDMDGRRVDKVLISPSRQKETGK